MPFSEIMLTTPMLYDTLVAILPLSTQGKQTIEIYVVDNGVAGEQMSVCGLGKKAVSGMCLKSIS